MAGKLRAVATFALFFAAVSRLPALGPGEYSFEMLPDGTPRFTQVLRWDADPNVLAYEVTVETAAGETVLARRVEEPVLSINLGPGQYRCRVVLYNLLGKPEVELPWRSFTVLKAEMPRVADVTPRVLFIEDLKPDITLSGENLAPGAVVVLKPADAFLPPIVGTETGRNGTSTVRVTFPAKAVAAGQYTVVCTNPGGLSSTLPEALAVRYERPVDVRFSAGYDPWVSLYDPWYLQAWPGTFFPLGASGRLSVWFVKQPYGHIGVELAVDGRLMKGGTGTAVIDSQILRAGLNGVYRYPFSVDLAAAGRIGTGVALGHYVFDYGGTTGSEIASMDLYMTAGLSLQYRVTKHIFLEAGADWVHVFASGFSEGGLEPFLSAGVLF